MSGLSFDWRTLPPQVRVDIWPSHDGWPLRTFCWEPVGQMPKGTLLFQTGRGDFFEKYLEVIARWVAQGWRVQGFDWRGSGGSGRLTDDPALGHADDFEPLLRDLEQYRREHLADSPGPHVLVGHSMGGNLMLRHLLEGGEAPVGLLLIAPMLGLNSYPILPWIAERVVQAACWMGRGATAAWLERPEADYGSARQKRLTSHPELYADELWWKQECPELHTGAASWGWLASAYQSIARIDEPGALEELNVPSLVLAAREDALVPFGSIERTAARMPDAKLVVSDCGAHELLREADAIRAPLLKEIDLFFDRVIAGA